MLLFHACWNLIKLCFIMGPNFVPLWSPTLCHIPACVLFIQKGILCSVTWGWLAACLRLENEVDMRTRHAISVLIVNETESRNMWKMGVSVKNFLDCVN